MRPCLPARATAFDHAEGSRGVVLPGTTARQSLMFSAKGQIKGIDGRKEVEKRC